MKKFLLAMGCVGFLMISCKKSETVSTATTNDAGTAATHSQEGIQDDASAPNIVQLASKNPDLSTLVKAVQVSGLATSLSNAGPFTVFAPLNSAFDKLPKATVENLLKPENNSKLTDILGHHTYVGVIKEDQFTDGQNLGMVDGKSITIKMVDGKPTINGTAHIVATVPASNGIVYAVDEVILPK